MPAVLTELGLEFFERQIASGGTINFNHGLFGDGGGSDATNTDPVASDTALVDQTPTRVTIDPAGVRADPNLDPDGNPFSVVNVTLVITGGNFTAREIGLLANPNKPTDATYNVADDVFIARATIPAVHLDDQSGFSFTEVIQIVLKNQGDALVVSIRQAISLITEAEVLDLFDKLIPVPEPPNSDVPLFLQSDGAQGIAWLPFNVPQATTLVQGVAKIATPGEPANVEDFITPFQLSQLLDQTFPVDNQLVDSLEVWDLPREQLLQPPRVEIEGIEYLVFSAFQERRLYRTLTLPSNWDPTGLKFKAFWVSQDDRAGNVTWRARIQNINDGVVLTKSFSAPGKVIDRHGGTPDKDRLHVSAPMTVNFGVVATNTDLVTVEFYRDKNDSDDTFQGDTFLRYVLVEWSRKR